MSILDTIFGCSHKWKFTSAFTTQPIDLGEGGSVKGHDEAFRKVWFGFTTVILRCKKCGEIKTREFAGQMTEEQVIMAWYEASLK